MPAITSTDPANPNVLAELTVDIPSPEHRLLVWYGVHIVAGSAGPLEGVSVGLDDGWDFAPGALTLGVVLGAGSSVVTPLTGSVASPFKQEAVPTIFFPYGVYNNVPSPGEHTFRLTAYKDAGVGASSYDNPGLWAVSA